MAVLGSSSPINSIQRGSVSVGVNQLAVNTNVTINSVDVDKSFISCNANAAHGGELGGSWQQARIPGASLTDATTLNVAMLANYGGNNYLGTGALYWEVIEYV